MNIEGFIKHYRRELKNARARLQRAHFDTFQYTEAVHSVKFYKGELAMALGKRDKRKGAPA